MGEGLAFPYANLDSTPCRRTGSCNVNGARCYVNEHIVTLGSHKYMIAIAALGLADKQELKTDIEIVQVDRLIEEVLKISDMVSSSLSTSLPEYSPLLAMAL